MQSEIYNILGDFIVSKINVNVIEANQNAPRDQKPFITIGITNTRNLGSPIRYGVDDYGIEKTFLEKEITVAFEAFSDTLHEAENLLQNLEDVILTDQDYSIFQEKLFFVRSINGVQSVSEIFNDYSESRALLECTFRYLQQVNVNSGVIKHVNIDDLILNQQINIDL